MAFKLIHSKTNIMTKKMDKLIHNPDNEMDVKWLTLDSLPHAHHHRPRKPVEWRNKKPTVVPGLTMSIQAMMAKANIGLPSSIPTRTIETFFRDTDLTDVADINDAYTQLAAQVQQKHQSYTRAKEEAAKQRNLDFQKMKDFIAKSYEKPPVSPNSLG